ncbi:MAG: glycosyltransferase family 4 protein [Bacteroidales bacterium]|nr:glycosyltransferase family 4 protein [Bacteroidales bacterium]
MKKVLIITYYWPPSGGAGVQRWLKLIKYLRTYGWEAIVYTPENPEAPSLDNSLMKDIPEGLKIIKTKIWEPYTAYKTFIGKKDQAINAGFLSETKKPRFSENIAVWIRGNLFIPDARKFWIKPSIKYLVKYLAKNPVNAIVSTGPPHSMHMIALGIKKKLSIPWLADFRDPWTNIDFYHELKLTSWADSIHKRMENKVLRLADKVVSVSWNWASDFEKITKRKIDVVTNGFDESDFENLNKNLSEKFSIVHIGAMNKDRNPINLWKVLSSLIENKPGLKNDIEILLIGKNDFSVLESIKENNLESYLKTINYLPHNEVVDYTSNAQLLLLALNNTPNVMGIIPGKIFEYLASKRPILCLGSVNGDSARIIMKTQSGKVVDFNDTDKLYYEIERYYELFQKKSLFVNSIGIEEFSRRNLCGQIVELLDQISINSNTENN